MLAGLEQQGRGLGLMKQAAGEAASDRKSSALG